MKKKLIIGASVVGVLALCVLAGVGVVSLSSGTAPQAPVDQSSTTSTPSPTPTPTWKPTKEQQELVEILNDASTVVEYPTGVWADGSGDCYVRALESAGGTVSESTDPGIVIGSWMSVADGYFYSLPYRLSVDKEAVLDLELARAEYPIEILGCIIDPAQLDLAGR